MPLTTRPFTVSLAIALLGAAGAVSAAPVPAGSAAQDPKANVEDQQEAPPPKGRPRQQGPRKPHRHAPRRERSRDPDPLSDSIRKIERSTRGQVISAESVPYDGRAVSRIKVVDEHGRVRVFVDDPQAAASDPRTRRDDD